MICFASIFGIEKFFRLVFVPLQAKCLLLSVFTIRGSRPSMYFFWPSPRINHLSKASSSFYWRIFRNQDRDARSACYYRGVRTSSSLSRQLENICSILTLASVFISVSVYVVKKKKHSDRNIHPQSNFHTC